MAKKNQNRVAPASDNSLNGADVREELRPQPISSAWDNVKAINERPFVVPAKS